MDWVTFVQLLCIAFIPFPTAILGEHVSDPVAQEFYFATILITGLATIALWWYVSSGHRLVDPDLPSQVIHRFHLTLLTGPVAFSMVMMGLIAAGIGRLINPLVLGYLLMGGYILLGLLEGWEPRSEGEIPEDVSSAKEQREHSEHTNG